MIEYRLTPILESLDRITNVVVLIVYRRSVLLGLSKHSDFRKDKWTFIGGGIKTGENPYQAAAREAKEESGIEISFGDKSKIIGRTMYILARPRYSVNKLRHNDEFKAIGFFDKKGLKSLKLADKTLEIINDFNVL